MERVFFLVRAARVLPKCQCRIQRRNPISSRFGFLLVAGLNEPTMSLPQTMLRALLTRSTASWQQPAALLSATSTNRKFLCRMGCSRPAGKTEICQSSTRSKLRTQRQKDTLENKIERKEKARHGNVLVHTQAGAGKEPVIPAINPNCGVVSERQPRNVLRQTDGED